MGECPANWGLGKQKGFEAGGDVDVHGANADSCVDRKRRIRGQSCMVRSPSMRLLGADRLDYLSSDVVVSRALQDRVLAINTCSFRKLWRRSIV